MTSCSSSDSGPDERDLFLGTYNATMTGSYTMNFAGKSVDVPLAAGGVYRVSKDGNGNRVVVSGPDFSAKGVVEGDILSLDPESETQTKDGITIIMVSEYEPAQIVNKKVTINGRISGTVTGGGYAGTLNGSFAIKATKQ